LHIADTSRHPTLGCEVFCEVFFVNCARLLLLLVLVSVLLTLSFAAFATTPVVTVTSPATGSQDSSPVNFTATASSPECASGIAAMRIYTAPSVSAYTVSADRLDVNINLSEGSYNTVVQAWDNCGGVGKAEVGIRMSSIHLPPPSFVYVTQSMQGYVEGYIVNPQSGELTSNGQGPVWAY
jgi:hypothetical protein